MNFYPYNHKSVVLTDGDLCVLANSSGRLCGYCSFEADSLPREWHGNYHADALQYLAIHGGITYCEVAGGDEVARIAAYRAAKDAIPAPSESLTLDERMAVYSKRDEAGKAALLTVPYTHVVFGFDCAHYRDEEDPSLSDPGHVLELARQMRGQIEAYVRVLPEWKAANRDTRMAMIDSIRAVADTKTELGFSALIGAMAGGSEFGEQQTEH